MNIRETWERIGIRPWRLIALLVGFTITLIVVWPLARNLLGLTCDAQEKAALMEFPQYGGKVIGKDIRGPLGGEVVNFPPLQAPPPGCELLFIVTGMHPSNRSRLTTRRSSPSVGGGLNGSL
jgi:hypothetical protein